MWQERASLWLRANWLSKWPPNRQPEYWPQAQPKPDAFTADFERHLEGKLASKNTAKNTEVAMTIFAIRSRIETPDHETIDAAARITNLTELEVVE